MKAFVSGVAATCVVAAGALLLVGCGGGDSDSDSEKPMGGKTIATIGEPEALGPAGVKPNVATDGLDQPHVVVLRNATSGDWDLYDKIGQDWLSSVFSVTAYIWEGSCNNPMMEIDPASDRSWISGITIGDGIGLSIVTRGNMSTGPTEMDYALRRLIPEYPNWWATGNLSVDVGDGTAVAWINMGYYERLSWSNDIQIVGSGVTLFPQNLGERPTGTFRISRAGSVDHASSGTHGVMHACYTGGGYQNSVRFEQGGNEPQWYNRDMGGDEVNFCGLCTDAVNPLAAYLAIHDMYGEQIVVNIWNGDSLVYGDGGISTPGTAGEERWFPQLGSAAGGGAWIVYSLDNQIMLWYISPDGAANGSPTAVCEGSRGTITVDSHGHIHLVYMLGGNTCYRRITTTR